MSSPQNKIIIFAVCAGIISFLAPLSTYSNNSRIVRQRSLPANNPVEMKTNYGKLPLSFIRNDGQVDSKVQFLERGNGHTVFFTSDGVVFSLQPKQSTTNTAFKLSPVNANKSPKITGEGLQQTRFNYLRGSDPRQWRQNVPAYQAIRYHDIYPGVDMRFYGNQSELEYDIIVQPGNNPDSIRLAYEGIETLKVTEDGNLEIDFKNGKMLQKKPVIYQEYDGKRVAVAGQFKIIDTHSTYGFEIASYDKHHPLIIDPTLMYASFLGGTADDVGRDIDIDSSGNAYIVGVTYSLDFPATTGTFDMTYNAGFRDTFIAKLDATGSYLIYATYIGGTGITGVEGDDFGDHIAVDALGNAYISGFTNSTDFPTTPGALDTSYNGGTDAFIVKLNTTGTTLLYSTYLGGSDYELGAGIAVDTSGNLYITGQTLSSDFPTTVGAYDRTYDASLGQSDAYVAKLNPTGTALIYSTFLGGSNVDFGDGIAIDSSRNAYVTGNTASTNFPVTTGAYDISYNGGSSDTFVAKLNTTGTSLVFATYVGGSGGEQNDARTSIGLDAAGNIFVSGSTTSIDFPTTSGAFQTTVGGLAGIQHPFVTKFNSTGTARLYSTFIAGTNADASYSLAVDAGGDAYIVGYTGSSDFPTTAGAYSHSLGGSEGGFDLFITRLNSTGASLIYSSYLGGSSWESGNGVAVDTNGNAYVTGITSSTDFPATPGAYTQFLNIGGQFNLDAFVTKFATHQVDLVMTQVQPNVSTINAGATLSVTDTVQNLGPSPANKSFTIAYRLSLNTVYEATDIAIATTRSLASLAAGASNSLTTGLVIPSTTPAGIYYVCAMPDSGLVIVETDETNNSLCSSTTVTVPLPDLLVSALSTTTTAVAPGGTVSLSNTPLNQGGSSTGAFIIAFHLSTNTVYGDADDMASVTTRTVASLGVGASSTLATNVVVPATTPLGTYYLCAMADSTLVVNEFNETNNDRCTTTTVVIGRPDLLVTQAPTFTPPTVNAGASLPVTDTVSNQGTLAAGLFTIAYKLSVNNVYEATDIAITTTRSVASLALGASSQATTNLVIPATTPAGIYYVCAMPDSGLVIVETNETNNSLCSSTTVTVPLPDLVVSTLTTTATAVAPGGTVSLTNTPLNQGGSTAAASTIAFHLSTNTVYGDADDVASVTTRAVAALGVGVSSVLATSVVVPATTPLGTYYLCALADSTLVVNESNETNNDRCTTTTVVIGRPDLLVTQAPTFTPPTVNAGASLPVTDTVTNQGTLAAGAFTIAYKLSVNTVYEATDIAITTTRSVASLAAGASNSLTTNLVIPATTPTGTYYVCAMADSGLVIVETNETNNSLCSSTTVTVPLPDLVVSALTTTTTAVAPGGTVSLTNTALNQGGSTAAASTTAFHLSTNTVYGDADDVASVTTRAIAALGVNATSTLTTSVAVPAATPLGIYYLCALADSALVVNESNETNNTLCTTTTVQIGP